MPSLYGEGATRAFERLQLEILSKSDDESLFAWQQRGPRVSYTHGLLASSPSDFRNSGEIYRIESTVHLRPPFTMTNKGLRMESILILNYRNAITWLLTIFILTGVLKII
jgi:hypothetical protein